MVMLFQKLEQQIAILPMFQFAHLKPRSNRIKVTFGRMKSTTMPIRKDDTVRCCTLKLQHKIKKRDLLDIITLSTSDFGALQRKSLLRKFLSIVCSRQGQSRLFLINIISIACKVVAKTPKGHRLGIPAFTFLYRDIKVISYLSLLRALPGIHFDAGSLV